MAGRLRLEQQHTLSSEFLGHDSFGNPQFDTKRSELGELVFRLKNRKDKTTLDLIADTAVQFLSGWRPGIELIVPMPPSRKRTAFQPVEEIALAIGVRLATPVDTSIVGKTRNTPDWSMTCTVRVQPLPLRRRISWPVAPQRYSCSR